MKDNFSIILETENLGMAGIQDLKACLNSLKNQSHPIKNIKEVIVVVGGHVSTEAQKILQKNYPWTKIYKAQGYLEYTKAKAVGAKIAKSKILIFVDSDVVYEKNWLKNIIETFKKNPEIDIVAGETRIKNNSSYALSLNIIWMIFIQNKIVHPVQTNYFSLNNFAIKRSVMKKINIPFEIKLYRGKIPLWRNILIENNVRMLRAPHTRGFHAPPGNLTDWLYRMLIYGSDFVAQADFSVDSKGKIIEKKSFARRLSKMIILPIWKIEQIFLNSFKLSIEDGKNIRLLPGAIIISVVNLILMCLGSLIALVNRDYMLNKINKLESGHVV